MISIIILLFAQMTAELALPRLMAGIIGKGIVTDDMPPYIYRTELFMLAISLLGILCATTVEFFSSCVASKLSKKIAGFSLRM